MFGDEVSEECHDVRAGSVLRRTWAEQYKDYTEYLYGSFSTPLS